MLLFTTAWYVYDGDDFEHRSVTKDKTLCFRMCRECVADLFDLPEEVEAVRFAAYSNPAKYRHEIKIEKDDDDVFSWMDGIFVEAEFTPIHTLEEYLNTREIKLLKKFDGKSVYVECEWK